MTRFALTITALFVFTALFASVAIGMETQDGNLVVNGGFEQGLDGWQGLWTRQGQGEVTITSPQAETEKHSGRIEYHGDLDWSFSQVKQLDVLPGEIYEMSSSFWLRGEGSAVLCVTLYDADGKAIDWSYGERTVLQSEDWQHVRSRFIIPDGAATMLFRIIGNGKSVTLVDDVRLHRTGSLDELRMDNLPEQVTASNGMIDLTIDTSDLKLTITDLRNGRKWRSAGTSNVVILTADYAKTNGTVPNDTIHLTLLKPDDMLALDCSIHLDPNSPEMVFELSYSNQSSYASNAHAEVVLPNNARSAAEPPPIQDGGMAQPLMFPPAFGTHNGESLIMPVNEGIAYPVDDSSLSPMRYHLFGGHGLCMPWYGAADLTTDQHPGLMTLVETADDAYVNTPRHDDCLTLQPEWQPQSGFFGPPRRIRYIVFDDGGYVAMCKRYREYAKATGLFKTLEEKRKENPKVDLLVGAVNIWCFQDNAAEWCRRLRAVGIERILWSYRSSPDQIDQLNAMGVLSSRYDIYQDAMNPAEFPKLAHIHSDWTSDAWPDDIAVDRDGQWIRGWRVKTKDGTEMIPCGVLCDSRAVEYARRRVPEELKTHHYRSRFIDTTTASPWRECYHPEHPMTRTQSKRHKMRLLEFMSQECGLVTGSETGHDAAVPMVHYFEGMMSLGPYRITDAGRTMIDSVTEPPERVTKFQTGHYYRLPLWELVYHDCVVSYWYWGDYNNKILSLWDRRDLLNVLYGTPPMFMFDEKTWNQYIDRFARSYETICDVARETGYREMLSHRWLTNDHTVQQTEFAGGTVVTVNFGEQPFRMNDGYQLQPMSHRVERDADRK